MLIANCVHHAAMQKLQAQPHQYHRVKHLLFLISVFFDICFLSIFFFGGFSAALKGFAMGLSATRIVQNTIYITGFSFLLYLLHFPLNVFSGYIWEHKFNLSTQKFSSWFADDIKGNLLGLVFVLIFVNGVYQLLFMFPDRWWIGAAALWLFLNFVVSKITPQVIVPLFYKYKEVRPALKERICALFAKSRVPLKDVYAIDMSMKTKKANAFVCGFGNTRRVVLGDTLIENFTDEEIAAVVSHELGHYLHRDILKLFALNGVVMFVGLFGINLVLQACVYTFALDGIYDISFLPVVALALMLFGLALMPLLNGYSRRVERQADQFCLEQMQAPAIFIRMMEKLAEQNMAQINPPAWIEFLLYDHPSIGRRIQFAQRYQEK